VSISAPWPTTRYGTSWRKMTIWSSWSDQEVIWEASDTIDPLKGAARLRPMVIVGFDGDGWLPVDDFAKIVEDGHDTCIVVDPGPNLAQTLARIREDFGDGPWMSVLGIARLDLADRVAYQALLAALEDCWEWFDLEMPVIEF
jgi:hypothetical protein